MPARVLKRWSLRGLSLIILLAVSVVALGAFTALAIAIARVEESAEVILRDMRSLAIADEIALMLNAHERLSRELDVRDPALANVARRREQALRSLVRDARPLASGPAEAELLTALERDIAAYFEAEADTAGKPGVHAPPRDAIAGPALDRALASVEALRALNVRDIGARQASAKRIEHAAHVTAIASGSVLLVVIAGAAFALRRGVIQPLGELRAAIERFRTGERDAPIPTTGPQEIVGIGTAFADVRDELARQRAQQAAFLAGIAHDLRNPLSPLKQAVALLRLDQKATPNERAARTLAIIDRQIDHLNRMISDLLDATRIEAGQLELSLAEIDLCEVVRDATELHRASTSKHELRLELPESPMILRADASRMQQVVGNLLSNAIKYSPRGGAIVVRCEHDDREARILVRDHGIGISPESMRELFEPFRRRERAREVAPGVGIGLSIVRRIVEAHGGRVSVESKVGEGSTFVVHLPLRR